MDSELTPEEKLLRLIKEGKSKKSKDPASQPPTDSHRDSPKPAVPPSPPPVARKGEKTAYLTGLWALVVQLDIVPRVILLLSVLFAGSILFNFTTSRHRDNKRLDVLWKKGSELGLIDKRVQPLWDAETLLNPLPNKNLFRLLQAPQQSISPIARPARVISLSQILSNYVLAGILGGAEPQAIIEDKKQGKTFFLSVGDTLGDFRITAITEGKVTVAVGNEEADLNL